jgi:DNA-directed RNA polymerase specialized sigma24 family protein
MAGDQHLKQAESERSAGEHSSVPDFESPNSAFKVHVGGRYSNRVEVVRRYLNRSDQGECLRALLEIVPSGPETPEIRTTKRVCRRLDPAKVKELVQGYADGVPVDALAERFNVDQSTVQKHARRHGLSRRSPRLGPNQTEEAIRLYLSGQSLAKLSQYFGVATDTVALALRRSGVTLRPRRGWPQAEPPL